MAKDPVCGMMIDEKNAKWKIKHQGKTFYFCCHGCKVAFESDPDRYIGSRIGG